MGRGKKEHDRWPLTPIWTARLSSVVVGPPGGRHVVVFRPSFQISKPMGREIVAVCPGASRPGFFVVPLHRVFNHTNRLTVHYAGWNSQSGNLLCASIGWYGPDQSRTQKSLQTTWHTPFQRRPSHYPPRGFAMADSWRRECLFPDARAVQRQCLSRLPISAQPGTD